MQLINLISIRLEIGNCKRIGRFTTEESRRRSDEILALGETGGGFHFTTFRCPVTRKIPPKSAGASFVICSPSAFRTPARRYHE